MFAARHRRPTKIHNIKHVAVAKQNRRYKRFNVTSNNLTMDRIHKDIAGLAILGKPIDQIRKFILNTVGDNYRQQFTKSNPDGECKKAKDAAHSKGVDGGLLQYVHVADRANHANTEDISGIVDAEQKIIADDKLRPFSNDSTGHTIFTPTKRGYCGDCWLCRQPVYYYWGEVTEKTDVFSLYTPCGDCEHVAAIVAAYLAGMLSSQKVPMNMIKSYLPSHSHCNKRKTNMVAVKFNGTDWEVDRTEATKIAVAMREP